MLCGVEVKIGSMVRLINDSDMYTWGSINETCIRPILYGYYVVRGFSPIGGFLLEGINNRAYRTGNDNLEYIGTFEPGFTPKRFVPVPNPGMSQSDIIKESKSNGVKIKIKREVIESLDLASVSSN